MAKKYVLFQNILVNPILPEFPPAYHACTIAPDMGLQFLSSTYPSTVIFLSGVNSPDGASVFTFGAPFLDIQCLSDVYINNLY